MDVARRGRRGPPPSSVKATPRRPFGAGAAFAVSAAPLALLLASAPLAAQTPGERWWAHVAALADDGMEGRLTGTPAHRRAVDYVASRFADYGLKPAGADGGWLQPVALVEQRIDAARSTATLTTAAGATSPLVVGQAILIASGGGPPPAMIDAPLVFVGYGLHLPEAGHDDFAGLDLAGKIIVTISGGPQTIAGALKSHARRDLARFAAGRGALGLIALTTPAAIEIPWARQRLIATQPGMYLADPALRDVPGPWFAASIDPASAGALFAGSGHDFASLAALADKSAAVPVFDLPARLRATVAAERRPLVSNNVVARLPGRDRALRAEHVVLSAHVDGMGVGVPADGDAINNGALDNAAGVASLLEIARRYRVQKARPRRSILFVVLTAEEKGLLGSRAFVERPTVAAGSIVADLNFDMALPLWPLTSVIVLGADQSSLGDQARSVGARVGLPVLPDPYPDRNSFVRSDQYSFIRAGIPALFFKFGFTPGSPESVIERRWRSTRYHSPADDLAQPVAIEDAATLDAYVAALALAIADAPARPAWNPDSFFRRFVRR